MELLRYVILQQVTFAYVMLRFVAVRTRKASSNVELDPDFY